MCPGLLALIILPDHGLIANGEVGGFNEGPAEILVAVLRVPSPFAFAVADMFAAHTAAIGGEVSDSRKPLQVIRFQKNRARQDRPDAGDRLEQRIARLGPPRFPDRALDRVNLLLQTLQHRQ
jgi:hypothetical protein